MKMTPKENEDLKMKMTQKMKATAKIKTTLKKNMNPKLIKTTSKIQVIVNRAFLISGFHGSVYLWMVSILSYPLPTSMNLPTTTKITTNSDLIKATVTSNIFFTNESLTSVSSPHQWKVSYQGLWEASSQLPTSWRSPSCASWGSPAPSSSSGPWTTPWRRSWGAWYDHQTWSWAPSWGRCWSPPVTASHQTQLPGHRSCTILSSPRDLRMSSRRRPGVPRPEQISRPHEFRSKYSAVIGWNTIGQPRDRAEWAVTCHLDIIGGDNVIKVTSAIYCNR